MKLLTFRKPDGGVSLFTVTSVPGDERTEAEILDAEEVDLRAPKVNGAGGKSQIVPDDWVREADTDPAEVPQDRSFRNAWEPQAGKVEVSMTKAREIHKNRLREIRAPKLAALDVEYQRADEQGDAVAKAAIAAQKQALRDVTADPAIDAAKTPEELKAVLPAALR